MSHPSNYVNKIEAELRDLTFDDFNEADNNYAEKQKEIIQKHLDSMPQEHNIRVATEYFQIGPITNLIEDNDITEILINDKNNIWIERRGQLYRHNDTFLTDRSFKNLLHEITSSGTPEPTLERPFSDGVWKDFRVHIALSSKISSETRVSLRRKAPSEIGIDFLEREKWAPKATIQTIEKFVKDRQNILIVGPTGTGKTTVLSAFLATIDENDRSLILEDTDEIRLPNQSSIKLLTRFDSNGLLSDIDLSHLLKQSLRMRPDRLVLGEVRGAEAKDLLLTLATGHAGGMTSLHSRSPMEAIIRLEMLVQLGAPQWSLESIRRLLALSVDYILTVERTSEGRRLKSLDRVASYEENGLTLENVYSREIIS